MTAAGWKVTPAGRQFGVPQKATGFQGPLASALTPHGTKLLSRLERRGALELRRPVRPAPRAGAARSSATTRTRGPGEAVFYGVVMSPDGPRAWGSGGGQNVVHAYSVGARLRETGTIPVSVLPGRDRVRPNAARRPPLRRQQPRRRRRAPRTRPGRTVTVIDPATNRVTSVIDLGVAAQPFGVAFERRGSKAYVTQWLGRSVSVIDTATETTLRQIALSPATDPLHADHPSAIAANPRRDEVYTANANSDTVSVIDTRRDRVARTIDVSLTPDAREGRDAGRARGQPRRPAALRRARGRERARRDRRRARAGSIGFIPTAWYPVDVDITRDGRRLVVTGANGAGDRPTAAPARTRSATAARAT